MKIVSESLAETQKAAADFLTGLKKDERATVVALYGDLGSGKTTFTQGIAKALGVKDSVTSPTFVLLKVYETQSQIFKHLIHVDAYRLEKNTEVTSVGLVGYLDDPENLILIEWPEIVEESLLVPTTKIFFTFIDETTREIEFS